MLALLLTIEDPVKADNVTVLYRRHKDLLYTIAYGITKNREDAEDAVIAAFERLAASDTLLSADNPASKSQLIVAAKNCAINIYNKNKIIKKHSVDAAVSRDNCDPGSDPIEHEFSEISTAGLPFEEIIALQDAIARLPREYSELLVLSFYKELTTAEIAQLKNAKVDTIQKKIRRAKQMLREALTEETGK